MSHNNYALLALAGTIVIFALFPEFCIALAITAMILSFVYWLRTEFVFPSLPSMKPAELDPLQVFMYMKSQYLKSKEWQAKRGYHLLKAGHCCELCSATGLLQLHHVSGYSRIPNEHNSDLAILCDTCHLHQHTVYGFPRTYSDYMNWHAPLVKLPKG